MERNLSIVREQCDAWGSRYLDILRLADDLFDGKPFSLHMTDGEYRPLAGIYDGVMVALGEVLDSSEKLRASKREIQRAYTALVNARGQRGALTGVASTAQDVKDRIAQFRKLLAAFV
jgi:hypothetical protein